MGIDCGPVLVADGDASFRTFLSDLLLRAGYATLEAATGEEALAALHRERPALIVLEMQLPDLSGFEVCRELRDAFGERLPIVFVSGERTQAFDRAAGLLIGADDYIVKPCDPDELLARVRRSLVRSGAVTPANANSAPGATAGLTARERDVLILLAKGFRTDAISRQLFISPKTVATHIQRILPKLGVHSRAEAVALAYRKRLVEDVEAAIIPGTAS